MPKKHNNKLLVRFPLAKFFSLLLSAEKLSCSFVEAVSIVWVCRQFNRLAVKRVEQQQSNGMLGKRFDDGNFRGCTFIFPGEHFGCKIQMCFTCATDPWPINSSFERLGPDSTINGQIIANFSRSLTILGSKSVSSN